MHGLRGRGAARRHGKGAPVFGQHPDTGGGLPAADAESAPAADSADAVAGRVCDDERGPVLPAADDAAGTVHLCATATAGHPESEHAATAGRQQHADRTVHQQSAVLSGEYTDSVVECALFKKLIGGS